MPAPARGTGKQAPKKEKKQRKEAAAAGSRGLAADQLTAPAPPAAVERLAAGIVRDGGVLIGAYRDPLGGHWQLLAGLPLERVEPTPYQRDLSEAHVARLARAMERLGRFLDPVIAVRTEDGKYWSPNGYHRLGALRQLGAQSIVALVVPEQEVARRILLLNTEKAHNLREKALEVMRLAEGLAALEERPEQAFEDEFEEAALLTLGFCYREDGRFSGGAYHAVLKRCDRFLTTPLPKALETRRARAARVLELNAAVTEAIGGLKAKGFDSPYLRAFVVARVNPLRFKRGATADFDETMEKMLGAAQRFDPGKVKPDQLARAGGPPEE
ncbi:MAG: ParB N-terminal domain-containing protein [Gemmatimonadales bacterium]